MEELQVVVAPLMFHESQFEGPSSVIEGARTEVPWSERPKVVVRASPDTTIGRLIEQAGQSLGLEPEPGVNLTREWLRVRYAHVGFLGEDDNEDVRLEAVLAEDGSAEWHFDSHEVTVRRLIATHQAGLLGADPLKMYLILDGLAVGGDGMFDVQALVDGLEVFLLLYGSAAASVHVAQIVKRFASFLGDGSVLRGNLKQYNRLFDMPRTTKEAARLINTPVNKVPTVCHFLGLRHIDGAWRPAVGKPHDRELKELVQILDSATGWDIDDDTRKKVFSEVLALPIGQRLKGTPPILRQLTYERYGTE